MPSSVVEEEDFVFPCGHRLRSATIMAARCISVLPPRRGDSSGQEKERVMRPVRRERAKLLTLMTDPTTGGLPCADEE